MQQVSLLPYSVHSVAPFLPSKSTPTSFCWNFTNAVRVGGPVMCYEVEAVYFILHDEMLCSFWFHQVPVAVCPFSQSTYLNLVSGMTTWQGLILLSLRCLTSQYSHWRWFSSGVLQARRLLLDPAIHAEFTRMKVSFRNCCSPHHFTNWAYFLFHVTALCFFVVCSHLRFILKSRQSHSEVVSVPHELLLARTLCPNKIHHLL